MSFSFTGRHFLAKREDFQEYKPSVFENKLLNPRMISSTNIQSDSLTLSVVSAIATAAFGFLPVARTFYGFARNRFGLSTDDEPFALESQLAPLGVIFLGGLWWTLRRGLASPRPLLWLGTSLLLRSGIVLFGFYAVGHGQWQRMMACLLGFILVRLIALRLARPHAPVLVFGVAQTTVEVHHAP